MASDNKVTVILQILYHISTMLRTLSYVNIYCSHNTRCPRPQSTCFLLCGWFGVKLVWLRMTLHEENVSILLLHMKNKYNRIDCVSVNVEVTVICWFVGNWTCSYNLTWQVRIEKLFLALFLFISWIVSHAFHSYQCGWLRWILLLALQIALC